MIIAIIKDNYSHMSLINAQSKAYSFDFRIYSIISFSNPSIQQTITMEYKIDNFRLETMRRTGIILGLIAFLALLSPIGGQILIPRCNICQRCTYCSSDVMYDCDIDSIYSSLLAKNPAIGSAFPVTITKTVSPNRTTYFFQFSNNKNITYQIIPKSATSTNASSIKLQATSTASGKTSTTGVLNSSTNILASSNSGSDNSHVVKQPSWTPLANASQVILEYVIRHFYLSRSSVITSLKQEMNVNTYTAVVRAADSSIKMSVVINPKDFTLKVSSISFLSGSLTDIQDNPNANKDQGAPMPSPPTTKNITQPPAQKQGIVVGKGISITPTLQQLLDYLYISYNALGSFQLDSFSTTDSTNYNLTLSSRDYPSVKYSLQALILIPVAGNLRGMGPTSKAFQIMSYSLINTTTSSSFTPITASQQLFLDPYAQTVIAQMEAKIIKPLSLKNLALVSISSSVPFYILKYEMQTRALQFLVQYDALTKQIRILEENNIDKTKTPVSSNKPPEANPQIGELTPVKKGPNSIPAPKPISKQNLNSNSSPSPQISRINTTQTPSEPSEPSEPSLVKVPLAKVKQTPPATSSPSLNFINHRVDSVFLKASSAINSIYPFNVSNIIKVSVINLSNTVNQYSITLTFNLPSGKFLQFFANYDSIANSVTFSNFSYTPQTVLSPSLFQTFPLSGISRNSVIMGLVSSIFMSYPQYFSSAVSSIQSVLVYPPYFNITYNNSVYGRIRFDCQYNYFTSTPNILNYTITQFSSPNATKSTPASANKKLTQNQTTLSKQPPTTANSGHNQGSASSSDLFCLKYSNGVCSQCAFRFYYDKDKKKCTAVQDECNTFDYSSCVCTACFSGYVLAAGACHSP